ncbi:MAG: hypothetical protein IKC42_03185 [Alistipes sp.]|nr:hypothetical protein [Alistipes sp.]
MENNAQWSVVTGKLYKAVLIQIVCNFLAILFGAFSGFSLGFTLVLAIIASIGAVVGYILFFLALGEWRQIVDANDYHGVNRLRTAVCLNIIGTIIGCIPLLGWLGGIICFIGFVLMLLGYNELKKSTTFPELAREGTGRLYTSMILNIIAVLVGFIPLAGGFIELVISIVAFYYMFTGWKAISES